MIELCDADKSLAKGSLEWMLPVDGEEVRQPLVGRQWVASTEDDAVAFIHANIQDHFHWHAYIGNDRRQLGSARAL